MLGDQNAFSSTSAPSLFGLDLPEIDAGDGKYLVRFARTAEELDAVLRLRFEVFNLELNEGLESSFSTGRDEDAYDLCCHHLMIVERVSNRVVGTYRLQTSAMAAAGSGFYSATEFNLSMLPGSVLGDAVELGRACIAKEHRNTRVLFLLWRGLALYLIHTAKRYLFGCCSLTSQNLAEGLRFYQQLTDLESVHPTFGVDVQDAFSCDLPEAEIAEEPVKMPTLFGMYLKIGARVISPPAIDRAFKTIDYLVLLDVYDLDERARKMFFGEC